MLLLSAGTVAAASVAGASAMPARRARERAVRFPSIESVAQMTPAAFDVLEAGSQLDAAMKPPSHR